MGRRGRRMAHPRGAVFPLSGLARGDIQATFPAAFTAEKRGLDFLSARGGHRRRARAADAHGPAAAIGQDCSGNLAGEKRTPKRLKFQRRRGHVLHCASAGAGGRRTRTGRDAGISVVTPGIRIAQENLTRSSLSSSPFSRVSKAQGDGTLSRKVYGARTALGPPLSIAPRGRGAGCSAGRD